MEIIIVLHGPRRSEGGDGFSLFELMIVIVITSVLAAVAVPIYYKSIDKAMSSEARAGIGAIRNELLVSYGIEGRFPISPLYKKVVGLEWNDIKPGELTGKYFKDKNFKYQSLDGIHYRIRCSKNRVMEKNIWLDETGTWKDDDLDDEE